MILEVAILDLIPGKRNEFETAFQKAAPIIAAAEGCISHELQRCVERPDRYILLVRWESLQHHTERFRKSGPCQEWKRLLHRFYDPFPTVEHYEPIVESAPSKSLPLTTRSDEPDGVH